MKLLTKLTQASCAAVMLAGLVLSSVPAIAADPGQIVTGDHNYQIANVTKGSDFANPQNADANDTLQYRLRLYNPGEGGLTNVTVEATINTMTKYTNYHSLATAYTADGVDPSSVFESVLNISTPQTQQYIPGSTQLLDQAGGVLNTSDTSKGGTLADTITMGAHGIAIGNVGESVTRYVEFETCVGKLVNGKCGPTSETPAYSCDAFSITANSDRVVKVSTFSTTATGGAAYKSADVNWGDNSAVTSNANIIGQTHQYDKNKDATYTITATAHFTVNGKDVTAGGPQCQQQVTFKGETPPIVTPPTTPPATPPAPTVLVNTGAGSVLGLFAAATVAGTVLYRRLLTRRLSNQ